MSPGTLGLLATTLPLVGFVLALTVFRGRAALAAGVNLLAIGGSLAAAVGLLLAGPTVEPVTARWFSVNGHDLAFGFLLDGPNLVMGVTVALVALLVQVYSLGYMAHDPGKDRYFAFMGLFAWSMLSFVYASNLLQMFLFWELVGLASFLLIGFWYQKPSASLAARKAFIMTRVGDVGLFLGLILLWQTVGALDVAVLVAPSTLAAIPGDRLTLIGILLFVGVMGKSAQFPLHTWLPDAMEGPTPVSALLHSATMVAAGVFLFARFLPLFLASETVITVVLVIAIGTAILSATVAMVMQDVKRVLAYSSISQLSFMLLGLAAGSLMAGVFHLLTHALFKALLFLCAGAFIHHAGTNDMVAIGRGGGRSQRLVTLGLVVGGAALAGLPPLAGFFSKEQILVALGPKGPVLVVLAYAAAWLTAYYTFRMIFLVTRPNPSGALTPEEPWGAQHHEGEDAHGTPAVMGAPIAILTLLTVVVGFLGAAITGVLDTVAGAVHDAVSHGGGHVDAGHTAGPGGEVAHDAAAAHAPGEHHGLTLMGVLPAVLVSLSAVLVAWLEYGRAGASQAGFLSRMPALRTLFVRKWYVDDVYARVVGTGTSALARALAFLETRVFDETGDQVARGTRGGGFLTAAIQTGHLQFYVATSVTMMAILGLVIGLR